MGVGLEEVSKQRKPEQGLELGWEVELELQLGWAVELSLEFAQEHHSSNLWRLKRFDLVRGVDHETELDLLMVLCQRLHYCSLVAAKLLLSRRLNPDLARAHEQGAYFHLRWR